MGTILAVVRNAYKRDYFHYLAAQFLAQFFTFGTILLVAKLLTPEELGEIKIIQAYAAIFITIADFGLASALLKVCAEDRDESERYGILRAVLTRAAISTAFALGLLALLLFTGVVASTPRLRFWMLIYSASIPFIVLTSVFMQFLQALKRIRVMAFAQVVIRLQGFIIVVIATWLWGFSGFIFATILMWGVGLWPLIHQTRVRKILKAQAKLPAGFIHMAVFAMLSTLMVTLGHQADLLILDRFSLDRAEIGFYSLAVILVQAAWLIVHSAGVVAVPYFSERSHDVIWFRRKLIQTQGQASIVSVGVGVAVFAGAWLLVPFVYGDEYSAVLPYLGVLLLKNVVVSSYTIIRMALIGLGKTNYNFIAFSIATPLGLVLAYVMLQRYGIIGVAWAQGITATVTLTLLVALAAYALRDERHTS